MSLASHSWVSTARWAESRSLTNHWELVLEKHTDAQTQEAQGEYRSFSFL